MHFRSLTVAAALAILSVDAAAHAELEKTIPSDGSVLSMSPASVVLNFATPVRLTTLSLEKLGEKGQPLGGLSGTAAKEFTLPLPLLETGNYSISWRAVGRPGELRSPVALGVPPAPADTPERAAPGGGGGGLPGGQPARSHQEHRQARSARTARQDALPGGSTGEAALGQPEGPPAGEALRGAARGASRPGPREVPARGAGEIRLSAGAVLAHAPREADGRRRDGVCLRCAAPVQSGCTVGQLRGDCPYQTARRPRAAAHRPAAPAAGAAPGGLP